ncbi:MAG: large subunit ribosomal protein [Clostridiales bacterium]|nr:large subunit ribosomal protein [Clostridiales bacterium]MDK2992410.1 large subunit ribosomal protein [Clostridiales bacterium]
MYAIIKACGKQYKVQEGDIVAMERLDAEEGQTITFDEVVMLSGDDDVKIGKPVVEGASVQAQVLEHGKGPKITVFKYKPKKDYRKKQGHRQPYTKVRITAITI